MSLISWLFYNYFSPWLFYFLFLCLSWFTCVICAARRSNAHSVKKLCVRADNGRRVAVLPGCDSACCLQSLFNTVWASKQAKLASSPIWLSREFLLLYLVNPHPNPLFFLETVEEGREGERGKGEERKREENIM